MERSGDLIKLEYEDVREALCITSDISEKGECVIIELNECACIQHVSDRVRH